MTSTRPDPIRPLLEHQGFVVLDGGLASELEVRGCDLSDDLWSARLLIDDPNAIRQVHLDYLRAGADCITSASYQATIPGLERRGLTHEEATMLLDLSVRLAIEARDEFWSDSLNRAGRMRPVVAASVGPYGAYLADGSEYRGDYGVDESGLYAFHRDRWHVLIQGGADLIACETVPSLAEVTVLARLLSESSGATAWLSLSCTDEQHLRDGSPLQSAVSTLTRLVQVTAIGANCVQPGIVPGLIRHIRGITEKSVIVYPNSGEGWDATRKRWIGSANQRDFGEHAVEWFDLGARLIGGCCRTGPREIRSIREALSRRVG
jgi:homocysteine S-methyltransferase